jgi:hypothetical protein
MELCRQRKLLIRPSELSDNLTSSHLRVVASKRTGEGNDEFGLAKCFSLLAGIFYML